MSIFKEGLTDSDKVFVWFENQKKLKELKDLEMKQRKEITALLFDQNKIGTQKVDLGNEWQLKAVFAEETKLDQAAWPLIAPELHPDVCDAIIKNTPSLIKKEYDKLDDKTKEIVDEAIVVKPKTPTLTVVPPKECK